MIDFNVRPDRLGTRSVKWEQPQVKKGALPMWVADMDFCSPPEVVEALSDRARHGVYGYTMAPQGAMQAVADWCARRYGLAVSPDEILSSPGVLYTLRAVIDVWTKPGDRVLIQTPAYPPFLHIPVEMGRELVCNHVKLAHNGFEMDWQDMEDKFKAGVSMMILCNPQNPTGRVWTHAELEKLAGLCRRYGVKVVSDEIHCDLLRRDASFTSFQKFLSEDLPVVTLFSATKTFNLAGLHTSSAIARDEALRGEIKKRLYAFGPEASNIFGLLAQDVAYTRCEYWLEEIKAYLDGNFDAVLSILAKAPRLQATRSQGTYLQFVDCTALGMEDAQLENFLVERCGVFPSMGGEFAAPGCIRLNLAMPRADVVAALERMVKAVNEL
ncbi:MAG: PatB family C-S lyase [Eubacteriales bacterium]|nr:PatB family C-S lyase [Eubacteriales bacterium]